MILISYEPINNVLRNKFARLFFNQFCDIIEETTRAAWGNLEYLTELDIRLYTVGRLGE